jgi:hypothetical protein
MNINGRLLLLVVATGLFVRIWMVNNRPRTCSPTRPHVAIHMPPPDPTPRASANEVVVRPVSIVSEPPEPAENTFSTRHSALHTRRFSPAALEETWTESTCPIPLPAGIESGIYRVADNTGRVARLEITAPVATAQDARGPVVESELYLTTAGSSRWYFIRLHDLSIAALPSMPVPDQPAVDLVAQSDTGEERPLCTNKKFDFTGYIPQGWTGAPDAEEIARPEPPDLPVPR